MAEKGLFHNKLFQQKRRKTSSLGLCSESPHKYLIVLPMLPKTCASGDIAGVDNSHPMLPKKEKRLRGEKFFEMFA